MLTIESALAASKRRRPMPRAPQVRLQPDVWIRQPQRVRPKPDPQIHSCGLTLTQGTRHPSFSNWLSFATALVQSIRTAPDERPIREAICSKGICSRLRSKKTSR